MSKNTLDSSRAYIDPPSTAKLQDAARVSADVARFLAQGGKIQQIPTGTGRHTPIAYGDSLGRITKRPGEFSISGKAYEALKKKKISRVRSEAGSIGKPVITLKSGRGCWHPNSLDAAQFLGVTSGAVTNVLKGRNHTARGYVVEYSRRDR